MSELMPGLDGMPPIKDHYDDGDKILIAEKSKELGVHTVANAYGLKWQSVVSWKRLKKQQPASVPSPKTKKTEIFIQSPLGGTITPDEIIAKAEGADKIYVRVDENKAYWVKGQQNGAVNLW